MSGGVRPTRLILPYGEQRIPYQVFYIAGQKSKAIIDVLPGGEVHVKVPSGTPRDVLKAAVGKRGGWIHRHLNTLAGAREHLLAREYVSGECHYYLGRRYVLKVFKTRTHAAGVKLVGGQLRVFSPSRDVKAIKALLRDWYREHARAVFARRLDAILPTLRWLKQEPSWKLLAMKRQWGSCSPKGKLSLNPLLVKAPRDCIDYVLLHELCHLKEHNHGPRYYRLLERSLPEWRRIKARLDGMAELLLAE